MNSNARYTLVLFVLANLLNYMDRYVLAAVLNPIGQSLKLDDSQLGLLATVFLLMYMFAAPLFSLLADRFSRTKLVAAGIFLWSIATAAAALANDFQTLLWTRALVGVGEAAYATIGPSILADLYPAKIRAKVFTWFYLAIPVGSALGFTIGGLMDGLAGWRSSFLVCGLPGILLAAFFWRMRDPELGAQDEDHDPSSSKMGYWQKMGALLRNRTFVACTLCYVGYTFAMGALTHWAPTLFQRQYGQSASEAGTFFGAIAVLTGIIGTFAGGVVTHRLQSKYPNSGIWISLVTLLLSAPFIYLGLQYSTMATAYAFWAIAMLLLFVNISPINAITVSCLPAPLRATGMAVNILFVHLLGDAISPAIVGNRSLNAGSSGMALASALEITIPAIIGAGIVLLWAFKKRKTVAL